jgi:signal transduction histidine kinase
MRVGADAATGARAGALTGCRVEFKKRSVPRTSGSERMLFSVFAAVICSFLVATIVSERTSSEVESLSESIVSDSTPSIERLAAVRGATLEVELALAAYLDAPEAEPAATEVDTSLRRLKDDIQGYLALPMFHAEKAYWTALDQTWVAFDQAARRTKELIAHGALPAAGELVSHEVTPMALRLIDASVRAIEFNAQNGRSLAERIKEARRRSVRLASILDAVCVLLGAAGAVLMWQQSRSRRSLVDANARSLEARALELEQFAGRVAHDIRNPLAAATMAAQLIGRRSDDEDVAELARRITRSLSRADTITTGLLEFARAGARPDPGARTSIVEVFSDLAGPLAREAESAAIELSFDPAPPLQVACNTGVYLSLLTNLGRNAIKYMGESPVRRIKVRAFEHQGAVRTEVVDTGPGVASEMLPFLFEPYFRVSAAGPDGLGLGLATVKKLAEGHNGCAGASSTPGKGSTFWFTLPLAGRVTDAGPARPAKATTSEAKFAELKH